MPKDANPHNYGLFHTGLKYKDGVALSESGNVRLEDAGSGVLLKTHSSTRSGGTSNNTAITATTTTTTTSSSLGSVRLRWLADDDPLYKFASSVRRKRVVELRLFGGLTMEEVAEATGVTRRTAQRDWRIAAMWLKREFSQT